MLELADEADSKSVGLIPRAGSTPATGIDKNLHSMDVGFCFIAQACRNVLFQRIGFVALPDYGAAISSRSVQPYKERVIFYENESCMEGAHFLTLHIFIGRTED